MGGHREVPWVCPMVGGRQRTVLEKLLGVRYSPSK